MAIQPPFLYRGTTVGWPGKEVLQQLGLTPTTSDPVVATLFSLWSARYGEAILEVCQFSDVAGLIGPANWHSRVECEVVIAVPPAEFTTKFVIATVPAQTARRLLAEIGIELAPGFTNLDDFRLRLEGSARLDERKIAVFDELLIERA
jgi:hypothetical protein